MRRGLLAALPLAGAASAQQYVTPPPPPPEVALTGPLDFCAEEFSVRLEAGERVHWSSSPYFTGNWYTIESGDYVANVIRRRPTDIIPPADGATTVAGLPLSPIAWRRAFDMPSGRTAGGAATEGKVTTFGIRYFLHGRAQTATPLYLLGFHDNRDARFPFLDRVDPRTLAERNCTPSRTDPALAGRIVRLPGGN